MYLPSPYSIWAALAIWVWAGGQPASCARGSGWGGAWMTGAHQLRWHRSPGWSEEGLTNTEGCKISQSGKIYVLVVVLMISILSI